ncbi:MAG: GMC family oxidoreductase [Acidobacteriota bacterium]
MSRPTWSRARDIDADAVIDGDLCIVGAGAAGITLALQFIGRTERVILLEGGDLQPTEASRDLYAGSCDEPLSDGYLQGSRLRFFGGTTNHWLGACLTLDPIDFETRDWLPGSGWPFSRETLEPFYRRAAEEICEVADLPIDTDVPVAGGDAIEKPIRFQAIRFGMRYRSALQAASNIEVVTGATVVHLDLDRHGARVEALRVVAVDAPERRFTVRARHVVLATGAIENARLLLASDDVQSSGVGNQYDLVGRYFQDHAVFSTTEIGFTDRRPETRSRLGQLKTTRGSLFRLSDDIQRERRLLNCIFGVNLIPEVEDTRRQGLSAGAWRRFAAFLETLDAEQQAIIHDATSDAVVASKLYVRRFNIRPEQEPDPENRVTLLGERDALGVRRCHLRWRFSRRSIDSTAASVRCFAEQLGRAGLGRIRLDQRALEQRAYSPGFHHIGTTRMHDDPRRGVVDADGRVHGVTNLYCAGSSLFPTSGSANPTLTIVALTLRLADHLQRGTA